MTATPATGSLAADADGLWRACFQAMASPCEVLIDGLPEHRARPLAALACNEALRIERTWSRYRDDTIVSRINRAAGQPVDCLLYTSPSPRDQRGSRMPSSA